MKVQARSSVYFKSFDWAYAFVLFGAFYLPFLLFTFWGLPITIFLWKLAKKAKKKDPEFFSVAAKAIKGSYLLGKPPAWPLSPVKLKDLPPAHQPQRQQKARKPRTVLTFVKAIRPRKPLTEIQLLRGK